VVSSEAVDAAMAAEVEDEEATKVVVVTEAEGGFAVISAAVTEVASVVATEVASVAATEVASVVAEEALKAQKSLGKTMEMCVLTSWR
jgi:hypothetical protein